MAVWCAYQTVNYTQWHTPDDRLVCIPSGMHTRRSATQSDIHQMTVGYAYQTVSFTEWHTPDDRRVCVPDGHLHRVTYNRWPSGMHTRRSATQSDITPDDRRVCVPDGQLHIVPYNRWLSGMHTRRSATHSDINQMTVWYAYQTVIYTEWHTPDDRRVCVPDGQLHRVT